MPIFSDTLAQVAAVIAAIAFAILTGFMAHWASGRTWGLSAHWGGFYTKLPMRLRVSDTASGLIFIYGIYVVIARAWSLDSLGSERLLTWSAYGLAALMGVSCLMNLASSSKVERFIAAPAALIVGALCFIIARSEWSPG